MWLGQTTFIWRNERERQTSSFLSNRPLYRVAEQNWISSGGKQIPLECRFSYFMAHLDVVEAVHRKVPRINSRHQKKKWGWLLFYSFFFLPVSCAPTAPFCRRWNPPTSSNGRREKKKKNKWAAAAVAIIDCVSPGAPTCSRPQNWLCPSGVEGIPPVVVVAVNNEEDNLVVVIETEPRPSDRYVCIAPSFYAAGFWIRNNCSGSLSCTTPEVDRYRKVQCPLSCK